MCLDEKGGKPRKFEHFLPFINHAWNLMEKEFLLLGKTKNNFLNAFLVDESQKLQFNMYSIYLCASFRILGVPSNRVERLSGATIKTFAMLNTKIHQ